MSGKQAKLSKSLVKTGQTELRRNRKDMRPKVSDGLASPGLPNNSRTKVDIEPGEFRTDSLADPVDRSVSG